MDISLEGGGEVKVMDAGTHKCLTGFLLTVVKYLNFVILLKEQNHKMVIMYLPEIAFIHFYIINYLKTYYFHK